MSDSPDPHTQAGLDVRRRRARRTALAIGCIAVAVYVVYLLSGVLLT